MAKQLQEATGPVPIVNDQGTMGRLVVPEHVEQLGGFGHGKREDQPVGLGGREGCLGSRCRGVSIAQA